MRKSHPQGLTNPPPGRRPGGGGAVGAAGYHARRGGFPAPGFPLPRLGHAPDFTAMSASSALFARAQQLLPGGVNSPVRAFRSVGGTPFFTRAARGAKLVTADGRELIDFVCTWGPAI